VSGSFLEKQSILSFVGFSYVLHHPFPVDIRIYEVLSNTENKNMRKWGFL